MNFTPVTSHCYLRDRTMTADVRKLLQEKLRAAELRHAEQKRREAEAVELFRPVISAMEDLRVQMAQSPDIEIEIVTGPGGELTGPGGEVWIHLGDVRSITTCRPPWSNKFHVMTASFVPPSSDDFEFDSADDLIAYLVEEVASFITADREESK